jgi:hypothetical protein
MTDLKTHQFLEVTKSLDDIINGIGVDLNPAGKWVQSQSFI